MRKFYFAMLAVAAGMALTAIPVSAAEYHKPGMTAPHGNVVQGHDAGRHMGRHFDHDGHPNFRRHFRPNIYFAPVYSRNYDGGGCYWLKRKALWTGSRYWWHRYNECRWG